MRKFTLFIGIIFVCAAAIFAQGFEGIKGNLAAGEVSAVFASENKILLNTKDGAIEVVLSAKTTYKRIPPSNPVLSAAVDSSLSEIGTGDKILVTGLVAADKKSIPAKGIYLITKADISKKLTAEQERWKTKGISGKITAISVVNREITVSTRSAMGEKSIVLAATDKTVFRRYAPDSVKYSDAKVSDFSELKIDDQIRALGDKSADGSKASVEEVLSGSFRMVGGKISAIDIANKEITIRDVLSKKDVVVVVKDGVLLKKFPAEMAQMMAARMMGGPAGGSGPMPPSSGGTVTMVRPAGQGGQPPAQGNGGGAQGGASRAEFDEMIERFPSITIADLKIGDTIAASSASGAAQNRVNAIKVLSGVEAFLNAPQIPGGGGRGGAVSGGIGNIPGLDGFGAP